MFDIAALERSLLTDRRRALWRPFTRAIRGYDLIAPGDRIAVCVSGGKDSLLLAVMMRLLQKHYEIPFEAVYLAMDPGYAPEHRRLIEENARALQLPCVFVDSDVFEAAAIREKNPCFMCARMRRGCLYRHARAMGCNKLALGHHYDDVIETTLMAMLYGGQIQAMPPMLQSKSCPDLRVIRPLYRVREADILKWRDQWGLQCLACACRLARRAEDSGRQRIKALIRQLEADDPKVPQNIFNSIHTAQLDSLVGWKWKGQAHTFRENVGERGEGIGSRERGGLTLSS